MFFSAPLAVLALVAPAFATVFVTNPVASTTDQGGQNATVQWQDDGNTPTLAAFGPAKISIYAGNAEQQTSLQLINGSVDVSLTSAIIFTVDPTIGPNSNEYFIRFESLSLKDATQPQFPALAFSAKFTLANMTGTFSAAVQDQINGQSTAPLAGQTAAVVPTSAASATITTSKASSTAASSTKTSASATATHNSALGNKAGWAGVILGAAIGISMF